VKRSLRKRLHCFCPLYCNQKGTNPSGCFISEEHYLQHQRELEQHVFKGELLFDLSNLFQEAQQRISLRGDNVNTVSLDDDGDYPVCELEEQSNKETNAEFEEFNAELSEGSDAELSEGSDTESEEEVPIDDISKENSEPASGVVLLLSIILIFEVRDEILELLIDMLLIYESSHCSERSFNQWLKLFKRKSKFNDVKDFPETFAAVQKRLFGCGLQQATTYYICDQVDHWHLFQLGDTKCPRCGKTRKESIKYPYYSMQTQLKTALENPVQLIQMLSWTKDGEFFPCIKTHYTTASNQFGVPWQLQQHGSETWHGRRWIELQWFLDPTKQFLLPERCTQFVNYFFKVCKS
jgi:hypothetical protein